jgi:quercetin dioxygenase-like cupin family protein
MTRKKAASKKAARKKAAPKLTARKSASRRPATTKTAGAIKAGGGRYTFDFAQLTTIDAGPGYSTSHGPVVEGERIQIGLMRMPRGTGSRPHSHPNEQWIYVVQGTLESEVAGVKSRGSVGSLIYIPANAVHSALATLEADVVFLTAKDMSHGIAGRATDGTASGPAYAEGFASLR